MAEGVERERGREKYIILKESKSRAPSDKEIEQALREEHLSAKIPLLKEAYQREFLNTIAVWVRSLPAEQLDHRQPAKEFPQYRGIVSRLCRRYDFSLTVVPSTDLFGIYGIAPDTHGPGKERRMTFLGRMINQTILEPDDGFAFLIDGSAAHALKVLPPEKQRAMDLWKSYDPKRLSHDEQAHPADDQFWDSTLAAPLPKNDVDVMVIGPSLEELFGRLWQASPTMHESGVLSINSSSRRDFFKRIDIQKPGRIADLGPAGKRRRSPISIAQIARPERCGIYGPYTLVDFLVSRPSTQPAVMLVRLSTEQIVGVALNGFPAESEYQPIQLTDPHEREVKRFRPGVVVPRFRYPFQSSMQEAFDHALHDLEMMSWYDQLLFVRQSGLGMALRISPEKHRREIAKYSQQTALWLAENIFYPIAQNPSLLGSENQIADNASVLINRTLPNAFNGNPSLAAARFMPAGEQGPAIVPAFGEGLFDKRGPMPHMGLLFAQPEIRQRFVEKMEKEAAGPGGNGWRAFLDFLFEEFAQFEPVRATELVAICLTPFNLDFLPFAQQYLINLDPRFRVFLHEGGSDGLEPPRLGSVSFRLLQWFIEHPKASQSVKQLQDQIGIDPRQIRRGLNLLTNQMFLTPGEGQLSSIGRIRRLFKFRETDEQIENQDEVSQWRLLRGRQSQVDRRSYGLVYGCLARPEVVSNGVNLVDLQRATRLKRDVLFAAVRHLNEIGALEKIHGRDGARHYRINPKWSVSTIPI